MVHGKASYRLAQKMKVVKKAITQLNRVQEGKEEENVKATLQEIRFPDKKEGDVGLSIEERVRRESVKQISLAIYSGKRSHGDKNKGQMDKKGLQKHKILSLYNQSLQKDQLCETHGDLGQSGER